MKAQSHYVEGRAAVLESGGFRTADQQTVAWWSGGALCLSLLSGVVVAVKPVLTRDRIKFDRAA